ncbi:DEAD/DEAH box helicase [Brevibacillus dissolubilis]|uniref:DEAD/DEAH box helicase n=1 Tax=Brevibacillus dissolubilis TaxID=1844116 RepID=UPI0011175C0F|nr:DEAD/DEAH box helicase [Brevibacillus dissolubilis]
MITLHGIWLPDAFFLFCLRGGEQIPVTEWVDQLSIRNRTIISEAGKVGMRSFQVPYWIDRGEFYESNKPKLSLENISGVSLSLRFAMSFLLSLSQEEAERAGMQLADDLQFWQKVTHFGFELMIRGRITPTVEVRKSSSYGNREGVAIWQPNLEMEEDERRLHLLGYAMPPACRAYDTKKMGEGWVDTDPRDIVMSYLTQTVDTLVREYADDAFLREHSSLFRGKLSLPMRWLKSLVKRDEEDRLLARATEWTELANEVKEWTSGRANAGKLGSNSLRLFFRLEPPRAGMETSADPTTPDLLEQDWTLRFFLQPLDDPSLLIPAEEVWEQTGAEMLYVERRFEAAQETLLGQLARAARIFNDLEQVLMEPRPHALTLAVSDAYQFLRETAEDLQAGGFGVQLPAWWTQKGRRRFGLKLKVRRATEWMTEGQIAAAPALGLEELLEFDAQAALGDESVSLAELEQLANLKAPLVQVRGEWTEVNSDELRSVIDYLSKASQGEIRLGELLHLIAEGKAPNGFDDLPVLDFTLPTELREMIEGKMELNLENIHVPEQLNGTLRPYQEKGFAWLTAMTDMGFGVCLADDMGLGKTVQLITLLLAKELNQPALIVCPTSLLGNWQKELNRFAPNLRVMVHHGVQREHGEAFVQLVSEHDVIVSSYSLVGRDEADFNQIHWSYLVLDESQNIKNSNSKQTKSIMGFRATRRIAMTGTPVENRLSELWSLFHFLNPGYLGSLTQFRSEFALPIERSKDSERAGALQKMVRPFILRRLKTDPAIITDLPEKIETKTYCSLTQEQVTLYQANVQQMLKQIQGAEGMQRRGLVLSSLTSLKQICDHPALFLSDNSRLGGRSGKMQRLLEIVTEIIANEEAVLVFTQYVEMGHMLVRYLQEELGEKPLFLYGGVSKTERDKMVESFQSPNGPRIFILSLKAGGVGLTLTRANHVIHFDRWWNPAVENQATDRAFRIGQKKNVQVHTFICTGTLEERIDTLIESKRELADQVIDTGEKWLTELSVGELSSLFELREDILQGGEEELS